MGRLIGYMANRADRMRDALYQERAILGPETAPAGSNGWGLGFYNGGEVLHKKRPLREGDLLDWEQIAGDVRSDCAVLHLRQPTVGDFRPENGHPFRLRNWMFAHHGTIDRFDGLKERLGASIPDFLRRNIRGQTDSEYLFHVLLSFLHEAGQLDNADVGAADMLPAIAATVALVEQLCSEEGAQSPSLNFLLTSGRSMFALRHEAPMACVERQGLHDPPQDYTPPPAGSTTLRYVLVASGVKEHPAGYEEVPKRSVLLINRALSVSTTPL